MCLQNVLFEPVDSAAGVAGADPVGVEGDKELCVQNVLYEPVDGAAVAGADPVGVEDNKELCVQNVQYSINIYTVPLGIKVFLTIFAW